MASSQSYVELLGDKLLSSSGEVDTATALQGKVVGIYFSAHWCPPCRGFTPKLAEMYKHIKAQGKDFEIVFASSDRDESAFKEYFGEQPWLALPYAQRDTKAKLSKKFKVSGIPTLVILDEQANVITVDGRAALSGNKNDVVAEYPWTPPTFWEALGTSFVGKSGTVPLDNIKGKYLALYFSAHWCPPCRGFTPKLAETYKKMKASGRDDFEFIFISSDRDESAFKEYHAEHPWLALPFAQRKQKEQLSSMFGVRGIPALVVVDPEGNVITTKGRGGASADPEGKEFPWHPKPTVDLCADAGDINEKVSVVLLLSGLADAAAKKAARASLEKVAVAKNAELKAKGEDTMCFFFAESDSGVVGQVRTMTKVAKKDGMAQLLLLDIPDRGGFYVGEAASAVSEATLEKLLSQYDTKELERKQLA